MNFLRLYCIFFNFYQLLLIIDYESQGRKFSLVEAVTIGLDLLDKDASWDGNKAEGKATQLFTSGRLKLTAPSLPYAIKS